MLDKAKLVSRKVTYEHNMFADMLDDDQISYRWSREPQLLKGYTNLIDKYFEAELSLKDSYKRIDGKDLHSHHFIVSHRGKVISGARLTINNPAMEKSLPSEGNNFCYSDIFPELDLEHNRCAEITRFATEEFYRKNPKQYDEFFKAAQLLTYEKGVKYVFLYAEKVRARLYAAVASKYFTRKNLKICDFSDWPGFEDLPWKKEFNVIAFENKLFNEPK